MSLRLYVVFTCVGTDVKHKNKKRLNSLIFNNKNLNPNKNEKPDKGRHTTQR